MQYDQRVDKKKSYGCLSSGTGGNRTMTKWNTVKIEVTNRAIV